MVGGDAAVVAERACFVEKLAAQSAPSRNEAEQMHRVKSFDVLSVAKISGLCYGVMGLIFVPFFVLAGVIAGMAGKQAGGPGQAFGAAFGVGMAIMMPILYGIMGFLMGALGAFIYNVISKWIGGIEVEIEPITTPVVSLIPQTSS
jgi:hypothetical protein